MQNEKGLILSCKKGEVRHETKESARPPKIATTVFLEVNEKSCKQERLREKVQRNIPFNASAKHRVETQEARPGLLHIWAEPTGKRRLY